MGTWVAGSVRLLSSSLQFDQWPSMWGSFGSYKQDVGKVLLCGCLGLAPWNMFVTVGSIML